MRVETLPNPYPHTPNHEEEIKERGAKEREALTRGEKRNAVH